MSGDGKGRYDDLVPKPPEGRIDLGAVLPGEGPLELDVGFGRGASLLERAELAPASRLLGIEIKRKWATKVEARRVARGLHHVRVFAGDAKEILARCGPDGCVRRVSLHFPDPWWKKRHHKRRVLGEELLETLARLLCPGGELFVQTDVEERADEHLALLGRHPLFEFAGAGGRIDENPFGGRSNRELRTLRDGLPVHRLLAVRR